MKIQPHSFSDSELIGVFKKVTHPLDPVVLEYHPTHPFVMIRFSFTIPAAIFPMHGCSVTLMDDVLDLKLQLRVLSEQDVYKF